MESRNGEVRLRGEEQLPENLSKRLAAYALSAAAGVGVLAIAPSAHANGIKFVNNADITIGMNSTEYLTISGAKALEVSDRETHNIIKSTFGGGVRNFGTFSVHPLNGGAVAGGRVASGAVIGPSATFLGTHPQQLAFNSGSTCGRCLAGHSFNAWGSGGFLPFKFISKGNAYFGWAHVSISGNEKSGLTGHISQFAYETGPNTALRVGQTSPSAVPEPDTLALLALGAIGLAVLRKKRPAVSN